MKNSDEKMATSMDEIDTVVHVALSQLTEITTLNFIWLFWKRELILPQLPRHLKMVSASHLLLTG